MCAASTGGAACLPSARSRAPIHDVSMRQLQHLHIVQPPQECVKAGVARAIAYVQAYDVIPSCIRCQDIIRSCYTLVPLLPVAAAAAAPPSFAVTSLRSFASFRYSPALRMAPCCVSRDAQ
jgi:hypothetical protein